MLKIIKKKWLNCILHLSSIIYKKKNKLLSTDEFKTFLLLFQLLFLQLIIIILTLPSYFFINKAEVESNFTTKDEIKGYYLRSKIAFLILGIIVMLTMIKVYLDTSSWYK